MKTRDGVKIVVGMVAWLARKGQAPLLVRVTGLNGRVAEVEPDGGPRQGALATSLYSRRERAPKLASNGRRR